MKRSRIRLGLRTHLLILGLVCFTPAFLAIGLVGHELAKSEQQQVEDQTLTLARQFRASIDRDLAAMAARLEALATSPSIDAKDFAAFQQQCEEVLGDRDVAIALRMPDDAQQIVNTLVPFGSRPLPRTSDPVLRQTDAIVMKTKRSAVSNLYIGTVGKQPFIVVDVPVIRAGHIAYLLSMAVPPAVIADDLDLGRLKKDGWLSTVVGSDLRVIARTRSPNKYVGTRVTSDVGPSLSGDRESGRIHSVTLDGTEVLTTFVKSRFGWSIIVAVPTAVLDAPVVALLRILVLLWISVLALSFLGAFVYVRVLGREVELLAHNAGRVGSPESLEPSSHSIREMDQAHEALLGAHNHIQELIRELNHRVKNTVAVIVAITGRTIADKGLRATLTGRITALSRAHEILSRNNWTGADLSELLRAIAHAQGMEIRSQGPQVLMMPKAAVALAQVFQELLTNAQAHGALRDRRGRVQAEWSIEDGVLRLVWSEICAEPLPQASGTTAFGLQVVELCIARQLGGHYEIERRAPGWRIMIHIPLQGELGTIGQLTATAS